MFYFITTYSLSSLATHGLNLTQTQRSILQSILSTSQFSSAESPRSASGSLQEGLAYSPFTLLCKGTTGGTIWSCCRTCRSERNGRERFGQCFQHNLWTTTRTIKGEQERIPIVTRLGSVMDFVVVCAGLL
ncbi:hypothetical protein I312_103595 [Cryptococcus bacillisporus CA1280]|uniref:uncharacterized protein n=1 Tax=Cryptococcus bacillisporus CA1280 TaxID=1296109 RepID=UPI003365BD82